MVIDPGRNINSSSNAASKTRQNAAKPDEARSTNSTEKANSFSSDSVTLSNTAQSLSRIEAAVQGADEVNAAKVAEIKTAIDNGTYEIDTQKIAAKILAQDDLV